MNEGAERQRSVVTRGAADTERFAARYARKLRAPAVVFLSGPLGSGKTTFCRGFLRALGCRGTVRSPTYTLLEIYELDKACVLHLDLYRISAPEELVGYGLLECFDEDAIILIEWPEHGAPLIPEADVHLRFEYAEDGRRVTAL